LKWPEEGKWCSKKGRENLDWKLKVPFNGGEKRKKGLTIWLVRLKGIIIIKPFPRKFGKIIPLTK